MTYTFLAKVLAVEEKFAPDRAVGKDAEGKWLFESKSLGWFVTTFGNMSCRVGAERPGISKGDVVKITLEKL